VVAHSLGGNATVCAAAEGASVGRLVLLSPMGDFPLYLDLFAARHDFGRRIRAGLQRRLEKRIGMPLHETNMAHVGHSCVDKFEASLVERTAEGEKSFSPYQAPNGHDVRAS